LTQTEATDATGARLKVRQQSRKLALR